MYSKLDQSNPYASRILTSDTKFLQPNVVPSYYAFEYGVEQPTTSSEPKCKQSSKCSSQSNSKFSKDPKQWGPHLWYYLHTSAANYPIHPSQEQKEGMKEWLCNLKWSIPCENCSHHFGQYIEKHKTSLDEICSCRESLFNFLVEIHNKVNARNGKSELNVNEAWGLYKK